MPVDRSTSNPQPPSPRATIPVEQRLSQPLEPQNADAHTSATEKPVPGIETLHPPQDGPRQDKLKEGTAAVTTVDSVVVDTNITRWSTVALLLLLITSCPTTTLTTPPPPIKIPGESDTRE